MIEFLEFVFEGPAHYFGVLLLIAVATAGLTDIARAMRGKP